jgi:hypothetical protein
MEHTSKNAVSIAKMFLDAASHARAAAILNALLAQIEAARPGLRVRLTADDWRRFGEILVLSDVESTDAIMENGMREAAKREETKLPQGDDGGEFEEEDTGPIPSFLQAGPANQRPVVPLREGTGMSALTGGV